MRFFYLIISIYLFTSCSNTAQGIHFLEGYWEIKKVETATGIEKEYTVNTIVEYFKVNVDSLSGYKKKMYPTLNNTYITSKDIKPFTITKNKALKLHYKNEYSTWTETIEIVTQNELVLVNQDKNRYFYKRFTPIDTSKK